MTAAMNLADPTDGATGEHASPVAPAFITAVKLKRPLAPLLFCAQVSL
jgi:hypothetical protein